MKIVFFANTDWYLYNFRLSLARNVRKEGWEVVFLSPASGYDEYLKKEGFRHHGIEMNRKGTNPLSEARTVAAIYRILKDEKPDIMHNFTIKPVLYGTTAARAAGVKAVVNSVTGRGHMFLSRRLKTRLLSPLIKSAYRFSFSTANSWVIFQNPDDLEFFRNMGIVPARSRTSLIRGSGVDTTVFGSTPIPDRSRIVVFASRMLKEKGLEELAGASAILKKKGIDAEFWLVGEPDRGNPSSIPEEMLKSWEREGLVKWLGHRLDMPDIIARSAVVTLPSYAEGLPRILIEAAAVGRPLVATDVPGCREVVEDGVNGLLVPPRDAPALADAIGRLLSDRELCGEMGRAGRKIALEQFDDRIVIDQSMEIYRNLLSAKP